MVTHREGISKVLPPFQHGSVFSFRKTASEHHGPTPPAINESSTRIALCGCQDRMSLNGGLDLRRPSYMSLSYCLTLSFSCCTLSRPFTLFLLFCISFVLNATMPSLFLLLPYLCPSTYCVLPPSSSPPVFYLLQIHIRQTNKHRPWATVLLTTKSSSAAHQT